MSQNLDIKINIKQIGLGIFDDVLKKIQEVGKVMSETDFTALSGLSKIGETIAESFDSIEKAVESIGGTIENVISNIMKNSVEKAGDSTNRILKRTEAKLTVMLSRISVIAVGVIATTLSYTTSFFDTTLKKLNTVKGFLTVLKKGTIDKILNVFNADIINVSLVFKTFIKDLLKTTTLLNTIAFMGKQLVFFSTAIIGKILIIQGAFFFLKEGITFFKRILGFGKNAVSPLERITTLITLADKATGRLYNTWASFAKLIGFGVATWFAPLLGIFPLLNTAVDILMVKITKGRDKLGKLFGSSRSSLILIVQSFRELIGLAMPALEMFVKNFSNVNKASIEANKNIKKLGDSTKTIKSISNLKFPFATQFQAFVNSLNTILLNLVKQINQITLLVQHVFAVSDSKINSIFSHASNMTKKLGRDAEKSSDEVFNYIENKSSVLKNKLFSFVKFFKTLSKGLISIILYPFKQIYFLINGIYTIATFTIKGIFSFIKPFILEVGSIFKDLFVGIYENFGGAFVQLFNILKKGAISFWNSLSKGFSMLWSGIKSVASSIFNIFKPKTTKEKDPILDTQKKRAEEDKKSLKQSEITSKKYREIKNKEIDVSKKVVEETNKEKKAVENLGATKFKLAKIVDFSSIPKPLAVINQEILLMTGTFDKVGTTIAKIKDVANPVSSMASIITFKLQIFNLVIQETILNLLNFEVASRRGLTNLLAQAGKLAGIIDIFGIMSEQIAKGVKVNVNVEKTMNSLLKGLEQFSKKFGDAFAEERFKKIAVLFQKFITAGFKFDPKIITKAFSSLEGEIKKLEKKGLIRGRDFGSKINSMIALGLKGKTGEIEKALQLLTELIASFFPQSPAKQGPLKKLYQMGTKIVNYLIQGMLSKLSWIHRAAFKIAEIIAKFFPRSLPILGPLISIVKSGALIPYYLAKGMVQGIGSVAKAATNLAKTILASLQKATDLGFLAERIGVSVEKVSALENVLADVGATSSDLSFVFTRMRDTLNKTFDKKELDEIKALGINLEEIKNSGDPLINLFFKVSNVLKNIPIGSKKAKKALELLGITTHSKLINVLMKGGDEIKELMKQGVNLGTTYDSTFVKMSQKITGMLKKLHRIKDFLLKDFIEDILPKLEEFLKNVLKQVEDNRINIQAFLKILYQSLIQVFVLIKGLFVYIITQPNKAFKFLKNGFVAFYNFTISIIKTLITFLSGEVTNFIFKIGLIIINSPLIIITRLFTGFTARLKVKNHELFMGIIKSIDSFFTKVIKYLKTFGKKAANAILEKIVYAILEFFESISGLLSYFGLGAEKVLDGSIKKIKKMQKAMSKAIPKEGFIEKMDKRLVELKKEIKPIGESIIKDLKKIGDEADKSVKKTVNGIDKVLADSKKAFDSTKKAFTDLVKDLKKGAEFLPDEFGKQINKFEKILSKVNFDNIKIGLEKEKSQQINNINDIDKEKDKSNAKKVEDTKAIADFIASIEKRISDESLSEIDRRYNDSNEKLEKSHSTELQKFRLLTEEKENISNLLALHKVERDNLAAKKSAEIWSRDLSMSKNIASSLEQAFTEAYEGTGEAMKEFFYASKVAAIAQATINIAQAITAALKNGTVLGIAQGAVISAIGGMQIGKIMAQTLSFNKGGEVPGTGNTDTVSAKLTPGEYVQPKSTVNYYGAEVMEAIRQRLLPRDLLSRISGNLPKPYSPPRMAFATGGLVQSPKNTQEEKQPINIVNVVDPNILDKYLSSSTGQKQIINILAANKYQVKRVIQ